MAAAQLEAILARLLVPDNAVIKQVSPDPQLSNNYIIACSMHFALSQATAELQVVYKDPSIVSPLAEVMAHSQNPQVLYVAD